MPHRNSILSINQPDTLIRPDFEYFNRYVTVHRVSGSVYGTVQSAFIYRSTCNQLVRHNICMDVNPYALVLW